MPYCPECLMEYNEGVTMCSDCGSKLLPGSPPSPIANPDDDVDAVLLLKADNRLQAEFLMSALTEEGIPFVAKGMGIIDGLGGAGGDSALHGAFSSQRAVEIYVNAGDFERAKEILDSLGGSELVEGQELDDNESGDSSPDSSSR